MTSRPGSGGGRGGRGARGRSPANVYTGEKERRLMESGCPPTALGLPVSSNESSARPVSFGQLAREATPRGTMQSSRFVARRERSEIRGHDRGNAQGTDRPYPHSP